MISAGELAIQTAVTMAFIDADPETVQIKRPTRVSDGSGGYKNVYPNNPSHSIRLRLIPQTSDDSNAASESRTQNGIIRNPRYVALMLPNTNAAVDDTFDFDGVTWKLSQIHLTPDYEVKFDVVKHVGR